MQQFFKDSRVIERLHQEPLSEQPRFLHLAPKTAGLCTSISSITDLARQSLRPMA